MALKALRTLGSQIQLSQDPWHMWVTSEDRDIQASCHEMV